MRVAAFQITKMHKKQYRFAAIDFGHTKNLRFEDRNGGFLIFAINLFLTLSGLHGFY